MEEASKDSLSVIAMKLDLPDLLKFCKSNKKIYNNVCNNENIWRNKLMKDYPDWEKFNSSSFSILSLPVRERYIFLYQLSLIKKGYYKLH